MVADRLTMFSKQQDNETFVALFSDLCREFPCFHVRVFDLASECVPGFVIEATTEDNLYRWRSLACFSVNKFTPQIAEARVRETLTKWKNFYLKFEQK